MFVMIVDKSKSSFCDDVNLKCKTMLLNHNKSQHG